jgi:hypothetical protein
MATNNKSTALANAQKSSFLTLADTDFSGMLAEELDGLDISFERIKIPSAGSTVFEMPGEDGEPDAVKEFSAVILYHHPLFCYYKTKYTGGNNPPDCGSFDGITGIGDPGGNCKTCPLNKFDTGENGSKACKNRRRIYVLREGEVFPLLLSLPTGSLKEFTKYLKRLLANGKKSNAFVTRFSLKKATNISGVVYSQAQFTVDRPLSPEEYALIEKLTEQIKAFSGSVAFDYENVGDPVNIDIQVDEETGEIIEPLNGTHPAGGGANV